MRRQYLYLIVGYVVGSYFGIDRLLSTLRGGVGAGAAASARID